uniref:Integrase catalytic domain-containing protein n=1 Tax=Chromera velia CCMP2878 TaxID=1169474 RepID=A0A0G4HCP6_9ALVE|eukprot:Cvel_6282.t1-p1 / transcript=Cvel_6282.t1 / gene=Cvel_6282 / organism=Chromera_velia_CCMP2878 / gene_product=hypothetical protein / transcript_product=hypothetical protein / location=Cvel_scaffold305:20992-21723(-) / protein_length=244 / sequence_SO=supercontig / SO=protein_coding / is_pseudo=false
MHARTEDWKRLETECRLCPLKNVTIPTLAPVPTQHEDVGGPFQIMQLDHWFPNDDEVNGPHACCLSVLDEYSGIDLDYPFKSRNHSVDGVRDHIEFVESFGDVQFQKEGPKAVAGRIRCDKAPEFCGGPLGDFVERRGMTFLDNPAGEKRPLGFVEGKNRQRRTKLAALRAKWKRQFGSCPKSLWGYQARGVALTRAKLYSKVLRISQWEKAFGVLPPFRFLIGDVGVLRTAKSGIELAGSEVV